MKKALLVSALIALVLPLAACNGDAPDCGPKKASELLEDATIVTAGFSFRSGGGFRPSFRAPTYRPTPKFTTPKFTPARPATNPGTVRQDNGLGFWLPFWVITQSGQHRSDCPAK